MDRKPLEKLPIEVSMLVRASAIIPSMHYVVEELILNCIDAKSTSIEIFFDFETNSVTIVDNGVGISESGMNSVGEWHNTSKLTNSHYGLKGEALAAICQLSQSVEIHSCPHGSSQMFSKRIETLQDGKRVQTYQPAASSNFSGTSISVNQLFHCFPVRQKASKVHVELNLIKEFIKKMCILHHNIEWYMVDRTNGQRTTLCSYSSLDSVSLRFASMHGHIALSSMKEINHTMNDFTIQGLLSPPQLYCCGSSKNGQYAYLNQRWLRNTDILTTSLNELYIKAMSPLRVGGTTAKHSTAEPKYPRFVLQVKCSHSEYDILSEPDKTVAVFRQCNKLRECIISLIRDLFKHFSPDLVNHLEGVIRSHPKYSFCAIAENNENCIDNHSNPINYIGDDSDNSNDIRMFSSTMDSDFIMAQHSHQSEDDNSNAFNRLGYFIDSGGESPHSRMFESAFDSFDINDNIKKKRKRRKSFFQWGTLSKSTIVARTNNAEVNKNVRTVHTKQIESNWFDSLAFDNVDQDESFYDYITSSAGQHEEAIDGTLPKEKEKEIVQIESSTQSGYVSHTLSKGNKVNKTVTHAVNNDTITTVDTSEEIGEHVAEQLTDKGHQTTTSYSIVMDRELLSQLNIIGQCDNKFIIAMTNKNEVVEGGESVPPTLIVFDQHAVDERINVELLQQRVDREHQTARMEVNENIRISDIEKDILQERVDLFLHWNFEYHIMDETIHTSNTTGTVATTHSEFGECANLNLLQVPTVLGEPLTSSDLLEFVSCVALSPRLPDCMMKPPAVERIIASKACRSSIKFGDLLTQNEMKAMLDSLALTNAPFHCAHGRPSVAPLTSLSILHEKQSNEMKKQKLLVQLRRYVEKLKRGEN